MAQTIAELVALEPSTIEPNAANQFTSRHHPLRMGNAANIAFGGCALAFAVNTASSSVTTGTHRLYSMLGHYLSAARVDRPLHASVSKIRDTKAFATRAVLVTQVLDDGSVRAVMSAYLDYHRIETASLLTYSVQPPELASPLSSAWNHEDTLKKMESLPGSGPVVMKMFHAGFEPAFRFFDQRDSPESVATQNIYGVLKQAKTSQDHLPLTEKGSYDWSRSKAPLRQYVDHITTLAFYMDCAVSFIPLTHSHMFLQDAAACSSLDFAFRIFVNDFDFNKWHLRDLRTVRGGSGRTYSVSRLFNESGELVAEMSQQSILRPHQDRKAQL